MTGKFSTAGAFALALIGLVSSVTLTALHDTVPSNLWTVTYAALAAGAGLAVPTASSLATPALDVAAIAAKVAPEVQNIQAAMPHDFSSFSSFVNDLIDQRTAAPRGPSMSGAAPLLDVPGGIPPVAAGGTLLVAPPPAVSVPMAGPASGLELPGGAHA
jgi:hypothetical protein